ncbi:tyrosine--tRNA ligase, mitochondrial-like [Tubulanus polymorphus]|uniref:tyrosine--tRNA ligase, mitochondrial-like n=1 Tax=Tubulanus polymorphus TaxID=672921 RepID=UPI003DA2F33D
MVKLSLRLFPSVAGKLLYCARCYSSRNILTLYERGILQSVFPENRTPDIVKHLRSSSCCVYAGFDPTADSLHIGNLLVLITLVHCQRAGHRTISLIGGATGLIGDPCGRKKERESIDESQLKKNMKGIRKNIENIFTNHESFLWQDKDDLAKNVILDNSKWYSDQNLIEFMSKIGRQFRMSTMLRKESVQSRLKSVEGMSYTEFSYQIFQAYDWLHLYNNYNCSIQIGGHDQLGNTIAGYELITSLSKQPQVYGLTVPLVTTSSGEKLGKSAGNAIWLDSRKTSPFNFYQHFINVADADVLKYLKLFTFLPQNEIDDLMKAQGKNPESRAAQRKLAEQVTLLVHGENGLKLAELSTDILYNQSTEALFALSKDELKKIFNSSPIVSITLEQGLTVLDLVEQAKCFSRPVDAYRTISEGGLYINHQKVTDQAELLIPGQHILPSGITLIRIGKKNRYYVVEWLMF